MVGDTSASLVNRALQQIAGQTGIIGAAGAFTASDGSENSASIAANLFYTPAVETLLRSQDWEFALTSANLVPYLASTLPWPTFNYPQDCVRIRQIAPNPINLNDPAPIRWDVVALNNGGVLVKFITVPTPGFATGTLWYQTVNVTEEFWDEIFAESVVRFLASEMAMAIGGRPDFSREKLTEAGQMLTSGVARDQ